LQVFSEEQVNAVELLVVVMHFAGLWACLDLQDSAAVVQNAEAFVEEVIQTSFDSFFQVTQNQDAFTLNIPMNISNKLQ